MTTPQTTDLLPNPKAGDLVIVEHQKPQGRVLRLLRRIEHVTPKMVRIFGNLYYRRDGKSASGSHCGHLIAATPQEIEELQQRNKAEREARQKAEAARQALMQTAEYRIYSRLSFDQDSAIELLKKLSPECRDELLKLCENGTE